MTEMELAKRLAEMLNEQGANDIIPHNCSVAIFVFRNEPEIPRLHTGTASQIPIERLMQWIRTWLEDSFQVDPQIH